ncbi:substrate-binding domain-containing protein [Piscinibacter sp.]|uniref:substrate-binding domain-containing protein n=1 Tax=Piscinibacter sp. TaxID=1903157 RepID=UPI002BC0DFC3|nr:substrate-binding domain-containing protein [Albitalea sp.]HUG24808.1 substrate-binding domain-containing protein [Albitalea sp.]
MTASLTGISSMATRQLLTEVADAWRRSGRGEVVFESVGGVDAARRVQDGEAFDIVVLASDAIDRLGAAGRIVAGSKTDLMRSGVAIAVRHGAPRPAVDCERELQAAVASARTIGYSTGPSGTALLRLFDRWGLAQDLRERLVQAPPGVPVGALVARGEVELGFQQLSELMHLDGIHVLGTMPPGAEIVTTFSGAVCVASSQPAAARALLDYIRSPAVEAIRHRQGMLTA